jgi:outer membrane protein assembly factor BamB
MSASRRSFLAGLGAAALVGSAGCLTVESPVRRGAWPRPGATSARTHRTSAAGPTGYLYARWTAASGEGAPPGTPLVVDDAVFLLRSNYSADDPRRASVAAYDEATGERRWETTVLREPTERLDVHFDSLCVADGTLYAQTTAGLHAVSPADGEELWTASLRTRAQPWPRVGGAPVVHEGTLVAGPYGDRADGVELRGFDSATGEVRWRTRLPEYERLWTLAAADGTVYAPCLGRGDEGRGVVALDAVTGEVRWRSSLPVDGPLAVAGDRLVVPMREGRDRSVAVVGLPDRETLWRTSASRRTDSGFAVAGGLVYYVTDERLVARRLDTGTREWSFGRGRRPVRLGWTPAVAGDVVYAMAVDRLAEGAPDTLLALGVDDGAIYGSGPVGSATGALTVSVVEGAAYLALDRGEVRCYESCLRSAFGRCLVG